MTNQAGLIEDHWIEVKDGDPRGLGLLMRHYSYRHRVGPRRRGSPTFVGPGEKMVLLTVDSLALFVWQFSTVQRYDGQEGVRCSVFRNEGPRRSSDLIKEAVLLAWQRWPNQRLFTYVNPDKIASALPGYCFRRAGWHYVHDEDGQWAHSKAGHIILEKWPA